MLIIILKSDNVIKNQFLLGLVKKQDAITFCQSEMYYKHKDTTRLKVKEEKNMYNQTLNIRV